MHGRWSLTVRAIAFAVALCVVGCIAAGLAERASAGTFEVDACTPYTTTSGVFQDAAVFGIGTYVDCGATGVGLQIGVGPNTVPAGTAARWYTETPAGLQLVAVTIPTVYSYLLNAAGSPWGGGFWWPGGGFNTREGVYSWGTFLNPPVGFFEFQVVCGASTCNGAAYRATLTVNSIHLFVLETGIPSITPTSPLYSERGWIRGNGWPLGFQTDDPSGVCHVQATVGSTVFQGGTTLDLDHTVWHQCSQTSFSQTINTTDYPDGPLTIGLEAYNAAGNWATPSSTVHVDNEPVGLSLSGPTLASTTAGTQYVTATASAGPSGVAIGCSVDGGPDQWQNVRSEQIPVSGAGNHFISCRAHNGAIDSEGQYAYSAPQYWSLNIGQPTVGAIGFVKTVNPLKCRNAREKVTIPARWVTVRRHHRLVKVRKPARTKTVTVQRCHIRIVWRRKTVWVKVRRHGKLVSVRRTKRVRVPLLPHTVLNTRKQVAYGRGASVSGWLGTASGVAIGGAPVEIVTAPNNGQGQFSAAAIATTAANGWWSAQLGPGPSRLVEAVYGGAAGLLPVTSMPVELNVPARIGVAVAPRTVPWSGVVTLRGHLDGGYVPPDGVALRLLIQLPHRSRPYEPIPFRTDAKGNFVIQWSWGTGSGVVSYPFAVATTATESDYPFAASRSRWVRVTFGLPTPHHHHPLLPLKPVSKVKRSFQS